MGPSGVGKTTLLNMIIPGLQNSTAPVSNKIKRGKNTTRNVELFSISNQSYIVDTPGSVSYTHLTLPTSIQV